MPWRARDLEGRVDIPEHEIVEARAAARPSLKRMPARPSQKRNHRTHCTPDAASRANAVSSLRTLFRLRDSALRGATRWRRSRCRSAATADWHRSGMAAANCVRCRAHDARPVRSRARPGDRPYATRHSSSGCTSGSHRPSRKSPAALPPASASIASISRHSMTAWGCSGAISSKPRARRSSAPTRPDRTRARSFTSPIPTIDQVGGGCIRTTSFSTRASNASTWRLRWRPEAA